jgi:hypothetical protein
MTLLTLISRHATFPPIKPQGGTAMMIRHVNIMLALAVVVMVLGLMVVLYWGPSV